MTEKSKVGQQRQAMRKVRAAARQVAVAAMKEVAAKYATKAEMARDLGESRQTVNNWLRRGAPAEKCLLIESKTGVAAERLAPLKDWVRLRKAAKRVARNQC